MNASTQISCATQGHLWNGLGYCIMCKCKSVRPDWDCSECGEPCNASVPHTCYSDYRDIKAENSYLLADNRALTAALQRIERGEGDAKQIATATLNTPARKAIYG